MRTKPHSVGTKTPLAQARRSLGFSQHSLARAAGVSRSTVARLEGGRGTAFEDSLEAIANALGASRAQLFPDMRPAVVVYRSRRTR